jgi:hypothetical protein
MPYKTRAQLERERWMTLPQVIIQICSADQCDERAACRCLRAALANGDLGPLKWERERGDRPPLFGVSSIIAPTDTPPAGHEWLEAKFCWKTGQVRDAWGEYKPGKWRVLLISRDHVGRLWQPPRAADQAGATAAMNITSQTKPRKRGQAPVVSLRVMERMRQDLRVKRFTVQELHSMTEEALKAEYGASRDTCRLARNSVLAESEFVDK